MSDEHEPEVIKQQMEETRASLTEKVATLETQVVNTVQSATAAVSDTVAEVKSAVQDTVETVRDTVKGTVESVKETVSETFDIRSQMAKRPVVVLGVSAVAGFLAGRLFSRLVSGPSQPRHTDAFRPASHFARHDPDTGSSGGWTAKLTSMGGDWLEDLSKKFSRELSAIGDLAVATVAGELKTMVSEGLPKMFHKPEDHAEGPGVPPDHIGDSAWAGHREPSPEFSRPEWHSEFSR